MLLGLQTLTWGYSHWKRCWQWLDTT